MSFSKRQVLQVIPSKMASGYGSETVLFYLHFDYPSMFCSCFDVAVNLTSPILH